jgi:hypothetical protein
MVGVQLAMMRGGAISGRITDRNGEPAVWAEVRR